MMPTGCDDYVMRDQRYPDPAGEAVERPVSDAIERMVSFAARAEALEKREAQVAEEKAQRRTDLLINVAWSFALAAWTLWLLSGATGYITGLLLMSGLSHRYWERFLALFGRD